MKRALLTGLSVLAFWELLLLLGARAADVTLFWQCASVNASGVVVTGQCPVGTTYPLPVTSSGGGSAITAPLGPTTPAANAVAMTATALAPASVSALGTSVVGKASAGNLYGFYCNAITGGSAGYCIAYNATAAPSPGALTGSLVLDTCYFNTPAGCSLSRMGGPSRAYSAGVTILLSSAATPFTYTTGTDTGFISADVQ